MGGRAVWFITIKGKNFGKPYLNTIYDKWINCDGGWQNQLAISKAISYQPKSTRFVAHDRPLEFPFVLFLEIFSFNPIYIKNTFSSSSFNSNPKLLIPCSSFVRNSLDYWFEPRQPIHPSTAAFQDELCWQAQINWGKWLKVSEWWTKMMDWGFIREFKRMKE